MVDRRHRSQNGHRRLAATFASAIFLLAGCGGGGDGDLATSPGVTPTPTQTGEAVAFQSNASHSGVASAPTPTFPLLSAWQRTFASAVSYPLIAQGKVFVIVGPGSNASAQLVAIDQTTGLDAWPAVSIGAAFAAAHAYDQGSVFVMGSDSILRGFDAATGAARWSTLVSFAQAIPPVARDGKVFVSSGNYVYAVDGKSGAILWMKIAMAFASPSLSGTGVVLAAACEAFSLLQSTGSEQWRIPPPTTCSESPSGAVAYAAGRAYSRAYDYTIQKPTLVVRNADTGALIGSANLFGFYTLPMPAVTADAAYVLSSGTLQRLDPLLQNVSWSFAGDSSLVSAPLVVGGVVLIGGFNGKLYAVDAATGSERWSSLVPAAIESPQEGGFPVTSGMAAANGILVVPAGRTLSTWRLSPS